MIEPKIIIPFQSDMNPADFHAYEELEEAGAIFFILVDPQAGQLPVPRPENED